MRMSKNRTLIGAGLALLCVSAPALRADDWSTSWSNGFKVASADKQFELKFGGRIMADYSFASVDDSLGGQENGFEFRRARLFVEGTIYERVEFKAQYDFAGGDADFKDMYIGLVNDWGTLRFGHFHEQFSMEEITSSKYISFLERSLPVEAFAPSRQSGVGVVGKGSDKVNWGFGAFYAADDYGDSTSEDATDFAGRVGFRPLWQDKGKRMLHLGLGVARRDFAGSTRYRARPEAHLASRYVDTKSFAADSATVLGLEIAGVFDSFWFAGELMQADVDARASGDPSFDGFYAAAGYFFTGEHRKFKGSAGAWDRTKPNSNFGAGSGAFEVAVRYSSLNLTDKGVNGGEQDDITVGFNWYLNPATRMMVNYVMADVQDKGDADFILLRWQVDF